MADEFWSKYIWANHLGSSFLICRIPFLKEPLEKLRISKTHEYLNLGMHLGNICDAYCMIISNLKDNLLENDRVQQLQSLQNNWGALWT